MGPLTPEREWAEGNGPRYQRRAPSDSSLAHGRRIYPACRFMCAHRVHRFAFLDFGLGLGCEDVGMQVGMDDEHVNRESWTVPPLYQTGRASSAFSDPSPPPRSLVSRELALSVCACFGARLSCFSARSTSLASLPRVSLPPVHSGLDSVVVPVLVSAPLP